VGARHVDVGGIELWVRDEGVGAPVVLLHGFPETGLAWRHQVEALRDRHRCIVPDLRGYGKSAAPKGGYDLPTLTGDIVGLLAALDLDRVALVGHDWGGVIALALARRRPELVERLVIVNAPVTGAVDPIRAWHTAFFQLPVLPDLFLARRHARLVKGSFRTHCYDPNAVPDDVIAEYQRTFEDPARRTAVLAYYRGLRPWNAARIMGEGDTPRCPALVIWGAHDHALPVDITKGVEKALPNLRRFAILPFAGHFVPEERPEAVSELLTEFLSAEVAVPA
jgi:pimeloyl-ACP methyl ester carboxylesterase